MKEKDILTTLLKTFSKFQGLSVKKCHKDLYYTIDRSVERFNLHREDRGERIQLTVNKGSHLAPELQITITSNGNILIDDNNLLETITGPYCDIEVRKRTREKYIRDF